MLLQHVHGFDNAFSDALTRAAFNREWLAASGQPGTNTTVVAFSWPSSGRVVALPVWQIHIEVNRKIGQKVQLGLLLRRTDLNDGQTEAVFGGIQGEGCS